ncbi:MAG: IS1595 family transposase [Clostridiaceae bacterium]|nr:IS1595 family transposase [Clostridiaceae bacterium]
MEHYNKVINILEIFRTNRSSKGLICAHCQSQQVIRYGTYNKKQRYKCKTCKKTSTDFTNSPLNMCHFPNKWPEFIKCTIKGLSLRESARVLKVSYITLFYWRHKLLIALKNIKNKEFIGLVEVADIFLSYSLKGQKGIDVRAPRKCGRKYKYLLGEKVCVLIATDQSRNITSRATLNLGFNKRCVYDAIGDLITEKNTLLFNQKPAYSSFCRDKKITFYNSSIEGCSINSGRSYLNNFLKWMLRFKGIASKYTNNYLSWYKFLNKISFNDTYIGIEKLIKIMSSEYITEINSSICKQRLETA